MEMCIYGSIFTIPLNLTNTVSDGDILGLKQLYILTAVSSVPDEKHYTPLYLKISKTVL